ncbi:MAG: NAD(P)H-hydrate dehydratase, partial [Candidatus Nanopelagicales bacterium]
VGICAGSGASPGAAVLSVSGARHGLAGYVRYAGGAHAAVVAARPDVVAVGGGVEDAGRTQSWVVGPGRGTGDEALADVLAALALDVPVLLDADALTVLAEHDEARDAVAGREAVTVLTPHAGEFARIAGHEVGDDRIGDVRALAAELGAVVLLKGSATVVASPSGAAFLSVAGPPELATAGSGDVLSGLIGSLLAHHEAVAEVDHDLAAALAAAGAYVHGVAASLAVADGRTITAVDVGRSLPDAVARLRRSPSSGL